MQTLQIESLKNTAIYPQKVTVISIIEAHIPWIVRAGLFSYKLKKAMDFDFLDFSSLEKRKYFCDEELRLNKRFYDMYLHF